MRLLAASASSTVTSGVPVATSILASLTARRAASRVVAATANTTWPWNSMRSATNTGSSCSTGPTSFAPGMSAAVSTATTPGAARTAERSTPNSCPAATGAPPTARCSSPSGSRMSSMKVALPATCLGAESCRPGRRTTRIRNSSARWSCADMRRLPEADHAGLARRGAADLGQRLAQQRARDLEAVGRARAQVVDRRKVFGQRRERIVPGRRMIEPRLDQRFLGRACALRDARHAAEGDARAGDALAVDAQLERTHHGGDVAVEALGDLVAAEVLARGEFRYPDHAHELARCPVLLAVVEEEGLDRHGARPRPSSSTT